MVLPHVDLAVGITPALDMDWKVITLTFLPHQLENFNALIDMMPSSDLVGLAPLSDYQRFIDALIKWARYKPTFPIWLKNPKVIRSFFLIRCLFLHRWPSR